MEESEVELVREMIQVLVRRFGLLQKEGAQCCGVSPVVSHILYQIKKYPHMSLNELADLLGLEKSTMSRHVKALIDQNYVISQASPEDKRYLTLSLTPEGDKLTQEISALMKEYVIGVFSNVPSNKRKQVMESLDLLNKALLKSPMCCKAPF